MKRAIPTILLSLTLSAAAFTPVAAAADAPAPADKAQAINEIYQQANRLYDAGQLVEAEALYQKAWNIRRSYDVASNLGALELDLNKPARAAALLSYALRQFPANGSERAIQALKGRLDKARSLSCTLRLKVNVSGADIEVDGEPQGKTPSQDDLFVEPGKRTITVKLGKTVQQQIVTAKAGQSADLTFDLPAPAAGPRVAPSPQVITVPVEAPRSRIPGFVAGGAGLVGIGVGAALVGLAESNRAEAQRLHDQLAAAGGSCADRSSDCTKLRDTTARADLLGNAGIGVLVAGSVLTVGGAAYLLWPSARPAAIKDQAKRAAARAVPAVQASFTASPAGGGLTLGGSF